MSFQGSCHCGRLRFEAEGDMPTKAMTCNCSICRRKGSILSFAPRDQVTVSADPEDIAVYTFKTHRIQHQFCKTCGCSPLSEATGPDGRAMAAINLRCAEGIDLGALKITEYDGASIP